VTLNCFNSKFQDDIGDDDELSITQAMMDLTMQKDVSTFVPEDSSESSNESELTPDKSNVQRMKMNAFLRSCNAGTIGPWKKCWDEASTVTRNRRVLKTSGLVVAALDVIAPGDAGKLWEALKSSHTVEKTLHTSEEMLEDRKYLEALAESYENASSWDTRRQILSVLADQVSFKRIQYYIPGLTKYRFMMARKHGLECGRGPLPPPNKSARMRIDCNQLDHFLCFITNPHIIQDLPFGQRYLHLSSGKVLETPNVIRTMIPQRILQQYQQFCKESGFEPFSRNTALRILSTCGATVRKSLQGLDYIAADGAKAFDDLCNLVERIEECGLSTQVGNSWKKSLKESKQYLKADYKVIGKVFSFKRQFLFHSLLVDDINFIKSFV
jgi:hypothetical protein